MIGLALSGGGTRGSYQVGVYFALRKCHIKFDGYVGTSIGSFNAAMLAAGEAKKLKRFWETVNVGKLIGFSDEYIAKLGHNKSNNLIEHLINNSQEFIKNKGFKTDGLYQILKELNLEDKIRNRQVDYGLVTVKAKGFEAVYKFIEDIPKGKLNDYILASCYLPVFKMQTIIDNDYYLDGGFKDNNPIKMLIDKDYDKIYVVDLHAIGIKKKIEAKDQKKLVVINPSHNLKSILNTNNEDFKYNIKLGYYDTLKLVKKLDGNKYIFVKYREEFYKHLIRKVKKQTLKEMEMLLSTKNPKLLVLRALEMGMKLDNYSYLKIYSPIKVIRNLRKNKKRKGIYKFIKELRIL